MNYLSTATRASSNKQIEGQSFLYSMEHDFFSDYSQKLSDNLTSFDWSPVLKLAKIIEKAWRDGAQVFLCGNGGSAGNASHIANDLIFAVSEGKVPGIKASALTANPAVITCLANDLGYEHIFSEQLLVAANKGDILVALSGSGNSPNIVNALKQAGKMQMHSAAILGFSGGLCKTLADLPIHLEINDMQMVEDIQIIIGHMIMKWLRTRISLIS